MCWGKAPSADPGIGQAQQAMAALSAEQWDYFKTNLLPDMMEQSKTFNSFATRYMQSSIDDAAQQRKIAGEYYDRMQRKFWPTEDKMIEEAQTAGGRDDQQRQVRAAQADVQGALTTQRGAIERQMARTSGDPTSGAAAQALARSAVPGAAIQAAAMGNAREAAKNLGWAKRADVVNMGKGLPSQQAVSAQLAAQMGGLGGGMMAQGMQGMQGVAGAMTNSANSAIGGYNAAGQMGLGVWDRQLGIYNNRNSAINDAIGGMLGLGGQLGGASILKTGSMMGAFSDRRLKSDILRIGTTPSGLPVYRYTINGQQEVGVMADEAELLFPDAVSTDPDGYKRVNYTRIG